MKQNVFSIPLDLLEKRLEKAVFKYKIVKSPPWELQVSKKPIEVAEKLSFSTIKLIPGRNILLTAETSGEFIIENKKVNEAIVDSFNLKSAKEKV